MTFAFIVYLQITGTGHGIGKELALQYAALGAAKVVCIDINSETNMKTANEINAKYTEKKAYPFICDMSSREAVLNLSKQVRSEVGEVSIIVNNAGIMPCHPIEKHSEKEIRKIFDINVFAHFWVLEAFLPHLIERGSGHVIALSSMAGLVGFNNLVPYCSSKFAVRGMMEALFEELKDHPKNPQIGLTTVFPYMVDTGLCKKPKIRFPSLFALLSKIITFKNFISW
jgi:all-trans-retinol dehydrogenase (NAD+)